MRSSKKVVDTSTHTELAMKYADSCIEQMVGGTFRWSNRQVDVTRADKGDYTKLGNGHSIYPIVCDVMIKGKVAGMDVLATVEFIGEEDLDHKDAVNLPDDISGPQFLGVDLVRVQLTEKGAQRPVRRAFEIDDIPGASYVAMRMSTPVA